MTESEILERLTTVFRAIFDDPKLVISDATTADDVADWDSISHVNLIAAVEKSFNVSFKIKEIKSLANVGDFVQLIATRVNAKGPG
jgi:acyl carrier protein